VITVPFNVIQWHFQDTITGDYRSELTGLDYPHEALCFVETADTTETLNPSRSQSLRITTVHEWDSSEIVRKTWAKCISKERFSDRTLLALYAVISPSVACCLQRSCTLLSRLKFSAMFLRH